MKCWVLVVFDDYSSMAIMEVFGIGLGDASKCVRQVPEPALNRTDGASSPLALRLGKTG